jgi:hypothetical protein
MHLILLDMTNTTAAGVDVHAVISRQWLSTANNSAA